MMTIEKKMKAISGGKIALMGHVVGGYPTAEKSLQAALGICEGGAAFLEVQFPFSDPAADGPVIDNANQIALQNGWKAENGFEMLKMLSAKTDTALLIMTYANVIFRYGVKKFCLRAKQSGVSGLIVPDLPLENLEGLSEEAKENNLNLIFVTAPGASADRIKELTGAGSGFLYVVARRGITGDQTTMGEEVKDWLSFVKANSSLPLACGFGISSGAQVKEISDFVEIAVAGSVFVRKITEVSSKGGDIRKALSETAKGLLSF